MPTVLSLEADSHVQESLTTALKSISERIVHRNYPTLEEFEQHITTLNAPKSEADQIQVLVLAADLIPAKDTMNWLRSLRQQMSQKGFCLSDNPIRLLILAYEDSHLHPQYFEIPEVFTYIIKPTDPLILKENLGFAITGYKQLRGQELKFRSVLDKLEMLKNIHFDEVSEVGFVTTSDTAFKPGVFSKYYSPLFTVNNNSAAFARLMSCTPHPTKDGHFQCFFEYVGMNNEQLLAIRKKIASLQTVHRKGDKAFPWFANHLHTPERPIVTVAIAIFDENIRKPIVDSMGRMFKNLKVIEIDVTKENFEQNPSQQIVCDLVLLDELRSTEAFLKNFSLDTKKILITQEKQTEIRLRERIQIFTDIVQIPVDKAYMNRKIYLLNPSLKTNEETSIQAIHGGFEIKAVMPVQITQASENHVEFSYHRSLPLNEIREFAIHGDEALIHTEIKGRCQFVQKNNNNKELPFSHQFLLLGQKDFYTKQMRIWMHRLYVNEAEKKL